MRTAEAASADVMSRGEKRGAAVDGWHSVLPLRNGQLYARARQTIYRAGEVLPDVPVIQAGWAIRFKRLQDGRRQILCFVLPGDICSAGALFTDQLNVSIEAVTPLRYAGYDRTAVEEKIRNDREFVRAAVAAMLTEQNEIAELAVDLGRRRAEGRIARLFLNLRERLTQRGLAKGGVFDMPLRQQHIADATGMTVIHVGRILGAMRNDGVIEMEGGKFSIANLPAFLTLADM
jgi:CRP/FNR family transcriptional regulator, anaerobic regulatory protein